VLGVDPRTLKRQACRLRACRQEWGAAEASAPARKREESARSTTRRHRAAWLRLRVEFPAEGMQSLRLRAPATYSHLYRYDRAWLEAHRPRAAGWAGAPPVSTGARATPSWSPLPRPRSSGSGSPPAARSGSGGPPSSGPSGTRPCWSDTWTGFRSPPRSWLPPSNHGPPTHAARSLGPPGSTRRRGRSRRVGARAQGGSAARACRAARAGRGAGHRRGPPGSPGPAQGVVSDVPAPGCRRSKTVHGARPPPRPAAHAASRRPGRHPRSVLLPGTQGCGWARGGGPTAKLYATKVSGTHPARGGPQGVAAAEWRPGRTRHDMHRCMLHVAGPACRFARSRVESAPWRIRAGVVDGCIMSV